MSNLDIPSVATPFYARSNKSSADDWISEFLTGFLSLITIARLTRLTTNTVSPAPTSFDRSQSP